MDTVKFGVFTRHPKTGRDMNIESYEFKLQYADEHKKAEVNGIELSKESTRTQAQRSLRSLIEISKTLDDIPESRWLTIALKYNKSAPKDYEPDQFEGASATVFNMSVEDPLKFDFKQAITPHVNLNVALEGRESLKMKDLGAVGLLRDLAGGEEPLDHRGIDVSSHPSATACASDDADDDDVGQSDAPSATGTMDRAGHIALKSTRDTRARHIALKSTRARLAKHDEVKSAMADPFSVVLYRFINVTRELALRGIMGHAR